MANNALDSDLDLGIENQPQSKKKLIILLAAVVVVLLAAGGGVFWYLLPDGESAPVVEEKAIAIYYPLDPLFVVNLPPGGKLRMLQVGVQAMTRDPDLVEFIQANDPMIRDQLLTLLGSQDGSLLQESKGKEQLQEDMIKILNKVVTDQGGTGEIEGIYFTSFVMQ